MNYAYSNVEFPLFCARRQRSPLRYNGMSAVMTCQVLEGNETSLNACHESRSYRVHSA